MKLNNKGWGLTEMLVLCSVLIIALLIAAIYTRVLSKGIRSEKPNETRIEEKTENKLDIKNNIEDTLKKEPKQINYSEIESKIELLSQRYVYTVFADQVGESIIIVDQHHLLEQDSENVLQTLLNNDSCKGYAKVFKEEDIIYYYPYIQCNNYTTAGLESYYLQ